MKHILKIKASKGLVRLSAVPKVEPGAPLSSSASQRRKVSVSSLTSTVPRTAEEIRKAIAQGRFAELKPEQV